MTSTSSRTSRRSYGPAVTAPFKTRQVQYPASSKNREPAPPSSSSTILHQEVVYKKKPKGQNSFTCFSTMESPDLRQLSEFESPSFPAENGKTAIKIVD